MGLRRSTTPASRTPSLEPEPGADQAHRGMYNARETGHDPYGGGGASSSAAGRRRGGPTRRQPTYEWGKGRRRISSPWVRAVKAESGVLAPGNAPRAKPRSPSDLSRPGLSWTLDAQPGTSPRAWSWAPGVLPHRPSADWGPPSAPPAPERRAPQFHPGPLPRARELAMTRMQDEAKPTRGPAASSGSGSREKSHQLGQSNTIRVPLARHRRRQDRGRGHPADPDEPSSPSTTG